MPGTLQRMRFNKRPRSDKVVHGQFFNFCSSISPVEVCKVKKEICKMSALKEKGEVEELWLGKVQLVIFGPLTAAQKRIRPGCIRPGCTAAAAHLRQAVDAQGATDDAGQANGPRNQAASEAAETLRAAFFTFVTDGVGQQLLMEEQMCEFECCGWHQRSCLI